ncbi:MAG TPA: hypothetical protein VMR50_13465 [Myxococcota bacterium]|nr:hypothetical protein [Myxococcota bacterium]
MRTRLWGLLFAAILFARPSQGVAAAVDITVSLVPGTTDWQLVVDSSSPSPVGGIALVLSNSLSGFVTDLGQYATVICADDGCPGIDPGSTYSFSLSIPITMYPLTLQEIVPPFGHAVLGTFHTSTSSAADIQVLPAFNGLTVIDTDAHLIPDFSIQVVPEPGIAGLFAASLALLLARRLG